MLIGITGVCVDTAGNRRVIGTGKDLVAARLVQKHGFQQLAWADPFKRFCMETFGFSIEQLWGPSERRSEAHPTYVRPDGTPLTVRYALTSLGGDWGRSCCPDIWVQYGLQVAAKIQSGNYVYDQVLGLRSFAGNELARPKTDVVISDLRHFNEAKAIRDAGGILIRVRRSVGHKFSEVTSHQSELELPTWDDAEFDHVLHNTGTIEYLWALTDRTMDVVRGRLLPYDEEQANIPPCLRR